MDVSQRMKLSEKEQILYFSNLSAQPMNFLWIQTWDQNSGICLQRQDKRHTYRL